MTHWRRDAWLRKLWRIEQGDRGLCVKCAEPAAEGRVLCERHRAMANEATKARLARLRGGPPRVVTCRRCGGAQHNVRTCTQEAR